MEETEKRLAQKFKHYKTKNTSISLRLRNNGKTIVSGSISELKLFTFFGARPSVLVGEMIIFLDEIDEHSIMPESMRSKTLGSDGRRTSLNPKKRILVLERDNYTCQKCGRQASEARLEVDHIIPVSKGGTDEDSNLQTLCFECNRGKGGEEL